MSPLKLQFHPLVLIPAVVTLVWALMMVAAPLSLPAGSVKDLSGSVGIKDNADQTVGMNAFARWVYDSGDVNCHQKASRSLFINDNEMPYCSRCTGIFFGLAIGSLFSVFIVLELKLWMIVGALAPIGIDGGMQLLGFWESTNPVRVVTGGLAGIMTGIALGFIFSTIETALRDRKRARAARAPPTGVGAAPAGGGPEATAPLPLPDGGSGAAAGPEHAKDDVERRQADKDR